MFYEPKGFYTNPGSPEKIVYSPKVNSDGTIELVESGKENTDEYIQSFAESTDISFILARLNAGDNSVLNSRSCSFGDFTEMPKTFAEVLQLRIDSKAKFDSLSPEVKQKFNNDENVFFATAGSDEWFDRLGIKVSDKVEKEVETNNTNNPTTF